jgi:hypothetical protein
VQDIFASGATGTEASRIAFGRDGMLYWRAAENRTPLAPPAAQDSSAESGILKPMPLTPRRGYNEHTVRKVIAIALALAVQATALSAPLVHAHPDDHATPHHAGRAVHTHWAGHAHSHHSSAAPAVGTADDDRAVFLNAFVAAAAARVPVAGTAPAIVELPVPAERPAHRVFDTARSHDPPFFSSLSSRAPPAFLS